MMDKVIKKDWVGGKRSIYTTLGASSHSEHDREEHDYYATEPSCAEDLLTLGLNINNIWECACGEGHLADVFKAYGLLEEATDLIDRGYGIPNVDFLNQDEKYAGWIVTNPPYKYAQEFCEKAIELSGNVAMFLKLTFLEGQKRKIFFEKHPPKYVFVYSSRKKCALNGQFNQIKSSASAYAWFVWEKGSKSEPIIKWI